MSFLVDSFLSSSCFGVGGATSEGQLIFSLIPLSLTKKTKKNSNF